MLGPTNTGKTHLAIERMLAHPTGMIGLPLRLLAREVYLRVVAKVGPEKVALVTGEEKIKPDRPRYWICTIEAMPRDLDVAYVAIDEIQLAADMDRGAAVRHRPQLASPPRGSVKRAVPDCNAAPPAPTLLSLCALAHADFGATPKFLRVRSHCRRNARAVLKGSGPGPRSPYPWFMWHRCVRHGIRCHGPAETGPIEISSKLDRWKSRFFSC